MRFFGATVVAVLSYTAAAGNALGPSLGPVAPDPLPVAAVATTAPHLVRNNGEIAIAGSVENLFATSFGAGPNREAKQDRLRRHVDIAAFARGFETARLQIAEARHPRPAPTAIAEAAPNPPGPGLDPIMVASLGTEAATPALSAITGAIDSSAPMPLSLTEQLAYARANTPASEPKPIRTEQQQKQHWCMAAAIYFEARGEAYRGQVAVAQVVMNRVKHSLYPDTVCSVVFQNQHRRNACQFSFACDGIPETIADRKAWAQAEEIATEVMENGLYLTEIGSATHYHATYVYPHWAPRMTKVGKLGLHVFYRFRA